MVTIIGGHFFETDQKRLIYARKQLSDGMTLLDNNIQKQLTLHFSLRFKVKMKIFVKILTGMTISLEVEASNTIENIKAKIPSIRKRIQPDHQRLIFTANQPADGQAISVHNVQKELTIHFRVRM